MGAGEAWGEGRWGTDNFFFFFLSKALVFGPLVLLLVIVGCYCRLTVLLVIVG